jgi:L-rhamnose mutarotase
MNEENKSTENFSGNNSSGTLSAHRLAFKMKLHKGQEAEYKKRHDELWPDLQLLLKETGVSDYSIFLEEASGSLFGVLKVKDPMLLDDLPLHPVMQKWWAYMKDIMDSNSDNSPVSVPLQEVFHLD